MRDAVSGPDLGREGREGKATHARPIALPTICMNVMSDVACGTRASLSAYSACAMMTYINGAGAGERGVVQAAAHGGR